jgi:hypothetical protein
MMNQSPDRQRAGPRAGRGLAVSGAALLGVLLLSSAGRSARQSSDGDQRSLAETRLSMEKWLETEQILSRERKDWQQEREILLGRLELLRHEVGLLEESLAEARAKKLESERKKGELTVRNQELTGIGERLAAVVTGTESEVERLLVAMPDPIRLRLEPLSSRIVDDPVLKRISVAERYQNVLGILNELNKANNEINVVYEVHTLEDGRPSEVQVIYVGLAQAYFVSAGGAAGIGRPSATGWQWQSSRTAAGDILTALEILQGKHSPAFVPLPVQIQ